MLAAPPAFGILLAAGNADAVPVLGRAVGVLGPQVLVALAATRLQQAAEAASALLRQQQEVGTAREIAAALHDDRVARAQHVSAIVEPVLADLAALQPADVPREELATPLRHRGCAGARVRRLLSEWHPSGPGLLGVELDQRLDTLQRNGLQIDLAVRGRRTAALLGELAHLVCDTVLAAVGQARRRARVTVSVSDVVLRVSVVADAPPGAAEAVRAQVAATAGDGALRITVEETLGSLWLETTCRVG